MSDARRVSTPPELLIDADAVHAVCRTFIADEFKKIGVRNAILGLSGGSD